MDKIGELEAPLEGARGNATVYEAPVSALWEGTSNVTALDVSDKRHPIHDRRYSKLDPRVLPASESLKDTLARVLPFWNDRIVAELKAGKNVMVVAHGNSLRAVVKMLDNVSEADITELNIPTGVPLVYELDDEIKPVKSGYLGDPEAIKAAAEAVKKQTEKKK